MIDIRMPQLGESIVEGTVARWLKRPGDQVALYEAILEVTTDKVDTEIPAPAAGVLAEILVPEGATVRVGTVIGRMAAAAAAPAPPTPATPTPAPAAEPAAPAPHPHSDRPHPPISPVVARLRDQHQLDLAAIAGSGIGGRITKQDVLRHLAQRQPAAPPAAQPATPAPAPAAAAAPPAADETIIPHSPMRRAIAEHMLRSIQAAPHATTVFEVDMGRALAERERLRGEFAQQGVRLTVTALIVQAVAQALQGAPTLNGRYSEEGLIVSRHINIGVAVALDPGLIVPVIRDAHERSLLGIARALGELTERARARRLAPEETQGGTFTITNHGVGGSLLGTPIINQPQSAILGVGAIVRRPAVIEHAGIEAIAIRPLAYLALSFDHRVCDGAEADALMRAIKRRLEQG